MITLELPPKVQIDKHIPSGYVILGYTEKQMHDYALELSIQYNKQLIKRILDLENKQTEMNAGWVRACDEEMISLHLGVANLSDPSILTSGTSHANPQDHPHLPSDGTTQARTPANPAFLSR